MEKNWQKAHGQTIKDFLHFLNKATDKFVLKGGTALAQCYKLTRFSEDIDLDSIKENIIPYVEKFCQKQNFQFRIAKNTDTVKRCFINYGNESKPLKIEVSYRSKTISESDFDKINGITVYTIDNLALMKAMAYNARDKLRDMYDLAFICDIYWNELSDSTKKSIRRALEYKGLEQFEYIVQTQHDELINEDELLTKFLQMYEKVELKVEGNGILDRFGSDNFESQSVQEEINKQKEYDARFKAICEIDIEAKPKTNAEKLQRFCKKAMEAHGEGYEDYVTEGVKQFLLSSPNVKLEQMTKLIDAVAPNAAYDSEGCKYSDRVKSEIRQDKNFQAKISKENKPAKGTSR